MDVCVCAPLHMQCFHSSNISADLDGWQQWSRDLWMHTSWTPEELEKTLRERRSYQAGHTAAQARATHMHVSASSRRVMHYVAPIRTCQCAWATQPFVCVYI